MSHGQGGNDCASIRAGGKSLSFFPENGLSEGSISDFVKLNSRQVYIRYYVVVTGFCFCYFVGIVRCGEKNFFREECSYTGSLFEYFFLLSSFFTGGPFICLGS